MKKEPKSAHELAELIAERIGMPDVRIAAHPDPFYGWHPTVVTTPARAVNAQNAAERAAQELRPLYELREERREEDSRPLTRPLAVLVDGKEQSLRTLGHAAKLLTEKSATAQPRASGSKPTRPSWWPKMNTQAHRDLATNFVEHMCRVEGLLAH